MNVLFRTFSITSFLILSTSSTVWSFISPTSVLINSHLRDRQPYQSHGTTFSLDRSVTTRLLAHNSRKYQHKLKYTSSNETEAATVTVDRISSFSHQDDASTSSSLDDSAVEFEEAMVQASSLIGGNTDKLKQNKVDSSNKMDSIPCDCEESESSGRHQYDALVEDLFISLVHKVRAYNPEAVEGIDFSNNFEHDGNLLTIDDFSANSSEAPGSLLLRAYQYAKAAHSFQCRKSGEPYITHPLSVAHVIADLKLDTPSLLTALLHDTVEDTPVTLQNITDIFSPEISHLVDGVTKVGKLPFASVAEHQSENYRKLILAMSEDIRVVLVKLADRTHNMRTLQYMSVEKQKRIARETMEIYVPIAHRLGIHWLKSELEDECFRYLNSDKYDMVKGLVREKSAERREYEQEVVEILEKQMRDAGLNDESKTLLVTGRTKGLYSIYTKMKRQNVEFEDVYDKVGFRIILDDVASCYQALGVIHSYWKPAGTGKIKDYIALPKPNGYKSLHTTVIGPRGKRIEVQIRTSEMHEIAESGIAAHWIYKQNNQGKNSKQDPSQFTWLRELLAEVRRQNDPVEFIDSVKEDLFAREVFVFSPNGDLYALARGASVLDFAYLIHSELGNHCGGAKVNGKIVNLKHQVQNGDTVEILKSIHQTPRREWLRYVRTSKAKNRIRTWLKRRQRERSITEGKAIIDQGLKKYSRGSDNMGKKEYQRKLDHVLRSLRLNDENELLAGVGYGRISVESVMKALFGSSAIQSYSDKRVKGDIFALQSIENQSALPDQPSSFKSPSKTGIVVGKERNIMLSFCKNCRPLFGETILGVITKGKGIKIHRQGCHHLLEADERRVVKVAWDADPMSISLRLIQLVVLCDDIPGVLANMCNAVSSSNFSIGSISLRKVSNGKGLARLEVMLRTADDMEKVISKIKNEDGIISVQRR